MKVLVVVDVQNDFVDGALGSEWAKQVAPNIINLAAEKAADSNWEVFATRDTHTDEYMNTLEGKKLPVPHCIKHTYGWSLAGELNEIIDTSRIIDKPTFMADTLPSAIMNSWCTRGYTATYEQVDPDSIDEIVLVGFCTSICVISNALLLRGVWPNKKITVYENLCGDVSKEAHDAALTVLRNCQIDVETYNPAS